MHEKQQLEELTRLSQQGPLTKQQQRRLWKLLLKYYRHRKRLELQKRRPRNVEKPRKQQNPQKVQPGRPQNEVKPEKPLPQQPNPPLKEGKEE